MMSILKDNFDNTVRKRFGKSIDKLESAFQIFGIDYYLIGAFVREVWTDHITTLPDKRATTDIDFAIYINEHEQFEALKRHLIEQEGFIEQKEPYRLFTPDRNIVDLIPFGGIEKNNEVYLKGHKPVELSVLGTKEVVAGAKLIEGNFKVITLPGLAVLKLVAWNESTGGRGKDLADFYYILMNYADMASDELYLDENIDLLEESDEIRFTGARLLGRGIGGITHSSGKLHKVIIIILEGLLEKFSSEDIEEMYQANKSDEHILRLKMIKELLDEYDKVKNKGI